MTYGMEITRAKTLPNYIARAYTAAHKLIVDGLPDWIENPGMADYFNYSDDTADDFRGLQWDDAGSSTANAKPAPPGIKEPGPGQGERPPTYSFEVAPPV